jgi:DNA-binding NarL/FixJ family response regulator
MTPATVLLRARGRGASVPLVPFRLPPMPKISTVIIEDEIMFRQLIRSTLARNKKLDVIGEFGLGQTGMDFCLKRKPDLLVVDLVLPDMHGLEIAAAVREAAPDTLILVLTAHPSAELPADLLALGVSGYVDKREPVGYVLDAIETICRGGMYFATHVGAKRSPATDATNRKPPEVALTTREQQIVRLIATGLGSKEIASNLGLGIRTVGKHRENIMRKVGVHEVASLTRWCIKAGLADA